MSKLPATIGSEAQLDELLSEPSTAALDCLAKIEGDILLLGVAGKMGPTLARMARRAADTSGTKRRIIGVSRFSKPDAARQLEARGVETVTGDLLDPKFLEALPDAPNVIYLTGMKFGSTEQEALTWAINTWLPAQVAQRFKSSRIVALSTGNVYGLVPAHSHGAVEMDIPNPVGEYAMSCLGRERMFEHFSHVNQTPVSLIRLNYAGELRYGVLTDIARQVWLSQPVDISMGWFNTIWQADANAMTLAALADTSCPPRIINVTGPEKLSIREVAEEFGRLLNRPVEVVGKEQPSALIANAQAALQRYGQPRVDAETLMRWIAAWVMADGKSLNKPTHFESRSGKF